MSDGSEGMEYNDPVRSLYNYEISPLSKYRRECLRDISRKCPWVLEKILIIQGLTGKTKRLNDGVVGPDDPPRERAVGGDWGFKVPLREGSHEVVN